MLIKKADQMYNQGQALMAADQLFVQSIVKCMSACVLIYRLEVDAVCTAVFSLSLDKNHPQAPITISTI